VNDLSVSSGLYLNFICILLTDLASIKLKSEIDSFVLLSQPLLIITFFLFSYDMSLLNFVNQDICVLDLF
jgi:hypothetical protein